MPGEGPSPQFIASLNAALAYFQRLEAAGDIAQMDRERQNINLVIELGLSRPETRVAAIKALLGAFQLVYARGYWQEGMETFEKALQICPVDRPDLKVDLLGRLGELQRINGRLTAAIATHQSELALAKELDSPLLVGKANAHLGHDYREFRQFEMAEMHCHIALVELEKEGIAGRKLTANVLNALGRIARQQGDLKQAVNYLRQSIFLQQELKDDYAHAEELHNLGIVYRDLQDYTRALQCFNEAAQALSGTRHIIEQLRLQNNIGHLFFVQREFAQAEKVFRGIDLQYLEYNGHLDDQAHVLVSLGNALLYQKKYSEAEMILRHAVLLWHQIKDDLELANAIGSLGEALAGQGELELAKQHFQDALALFANYADLPRGKRQIAFFTTELKKLK